MVIADQFEVLLTDLLVNNEPLVKLLRSLVLT